MGAYGKSETSTTTRTTYEGKKKEEEHQKEEVEEEEEEDHMKHPGSTFKDGSKRAMLVTMERLLTKEKWDNIWSNDILPLVGTTIEAMHCQKRRRKMGRAKLRVC